jgi:Mn2+/Fe2+ NRAMP family transporter
MAETEIRDVEAPPPGEVFTQPWSPRKITGLLAVFGPAAIVASVSIGAGETIVVVRAGAWAGYGLLWLVLLSSVVKGVFVTYLLGRYTAVSGEQIGHRLARLPGPRGWLPLSLLGLEMIAAPMAWVGIVKPCGALVRTMLTGILPASLSDSAWDNLFATGLILLALLLGLGVSFRSLEKQQVAICCILVGGTMIGTLMVRPDFLQALAGSFRVGHLPPFPAWAPDEARNHPLLMVATTFGYVGGSVLSYIVYANWIGLHGWGMTSHPEIDAIRRHAATRRTIDYLSETPESIRRMRLALSPLRWDVGMGAVVLFVVTAAFMVSGAAVLFPLLASGRLPGGFQGWSLLTDQAHVWRSIHPWLVWVYYVTVIAALWGTLQALPEIYARVSQEFFQAVWPKRVWDYGRLQRAVGVYIFASTMPLVWSNIAFDTLIQIASFLLANLAIALAMIAALALNFKLPPVYRTHPWMLGGAVLSAIVLVLFAGISGWGLTAKLLGGG